MNQPLVNLRVDFAFKQLFGTRGNEQILMQFLNVTLVSSLSSPIQSLTIEDPHMHIRKGQIVHSRCISNFRR